MHDGNDWTMLRSHNSSYSDKGKIVDLMAINTTDIYILGMCGFVDNAHITASKSTIGTTIYKRTSLVSIVLRDMVVYTMHLNTTIALSIDNYFIIRRGILWPRFVTQSTPKITRMSRCGLLSGTD